MDNRYEIAEQNGMSREFADWFFDNKKAGCGNVWFMMMAAMWEGWQGRAAMLQGAENAESPSSNYPVIPDGWVACSERMPEEGDDMIVFTDEIVMSGVSYSKKKGFYLQALEYDDDEPVDNVTHWMPLPAAPQQGKSL